jgi:spore germination protein YaaH
MYMFRKILFALFFLILGAAATYSAYLYFFPDSRAKTPAQIISRALPHEKKVIGFLPYWLLSAADKDYSQYITTLTYFGLTVEGDGTIQKYTNPGEAEPGWYALESGKVDKFLADAKDNNLELSLLVFAGNEESITELMEYPTRHARTLVNEVAPIMKKYGFTDLNIDIESVALASPESQQKFTTFMKELKVQVDRKKLGTITLEASPTALIKEYLIDLKQVHQYVDYVVFMTYDFHYPGSHVTGPVAQLSGAMIEAEFDSEVGLKEALKIMSPSKVLIGMPLYGYEWETLTTDPRAATIPGTGITASHRRVQKFLDECATCSATIDEFGQEGHLVYFDEEVNTYHQIFYPTVETMEREIEIARELNLRGIAMWALGYEGDDILEPLVDYK